MIGQICLHVCFFLFLSVRCVCVCLFVRLVRLFVWFFVAYLATNLLTSHLRRLTYLPWGLSNYSSVCITISLPLPFSHSVNPSADPSIRLIIIISIFYLSYLSIPLRCPHLSILSYYHVFISILLIVSDLSILSMFFFVCLFLLFPCLFPAQICSMIFLFIPYISLRTMIFSWLSNNFLMWSMYFPMRSNAFYVPFCIQSSYNPSNSVKRHHTQT